MHAERVVAVVVAEMAAFHVERKDIGLVTVPREEEEVVASEEEEVAVVVDMEEVVVAVAEGDQGQGPGQGHPEDQGQGLLEGLPEGPGLLPLLLLAAEGPAPGALPHPEETGKLTSWNVSIKRFIDCIVH